METNLYYQDPELSLGSLAEKLGMHPHELSKVINTVFKKSFNDFINEYRVRDVVSKMQGPAYAHFTLLGIAFESGFNSRSTFNRIFRQITGKSPQEYMAKLKKEHPSYNLGGHSKLASVILPRATAIKWPHGKLNRNYMFRNYFKTAWRNLTRQKTLSLINVFGLSVGIACFSLFMLYAVNELNYDNFHKNKANLFRVYQYNEAVGDNAANAMPYGPQPLGPGMKQDLPGIENYVRFLDNWGESFIKTDNGLLRDNVSFADPAILTVFSFKLKYGNPSTALLGLQNIVLTESEAVKIFGKEDVIGKILQIKQDDRFVPFIVTAVAEDVPSNSTIKFSMLCNFNFFTTTQPGRRGVNNWNQISYQTFLQLKPGSTLKDDKNLLNAFRKK